MKRRNLFKKENERNGGMAGRKKEERKRQNKIIGKKISIERKIERMKDRMYK